MIIIKEILPPTLMQCYLSSERHNQKVQRKKKMPSAAKFKDDSSKFLRLAGSSALRRQAQPPNSCSPPSLVSRNSLNQAITRDRPAPHPHTSHHHHPHLSCCVHKCMSNASSPAPRHDELAATRETTRGLQVQLAIGYDF